MFEREIAERLARIEVTVESTHEELSALKRAVFGYNGQLPGLMTRLDRIEQGERRRKWAVRAILVGLVSIVAEAVARFVR